MPDLRYTLVSDGSSDRALIPILTWLLRKNGVTSAIQSEWADLRELRVNEGLTLRQKIRKGVHLYPCELLFVHRDAENTRIEIRRQEIEDAVADLDVPPYVCVIPVKMQEAWLLFDEMAIRHAAGNPNGRTPLNLPELRRLETRADPKDTLYELLKTASGLNGRRLKKFRPAQRAGRVSEFTDDFSPLRTLSAFAVLEALIHEIVQQQGWSS